MDNGFARDLAPWGPESRYRAVLPGKSGGDIAGGWRIGHYENFSVASLLLPRRLLPHFHAIYAYCRWADDLGDETGGGSTALGLLAMVARGIGACYDGTPRHPVMIALRRTIRRFRIPPEPFLDLICAFEQDQHVKRYQTYEQLVGLLPLLRQSGGTSGPVSVRVL